MTHETVDGGSFEERLAALKLAFARGLAGRAEVIEAQVRERAPNPEGLGELQRAVHSLVGTSGVHGMTAVASAGRAMLARLEQASASDAMCEWEETVVLLAVMRETAGAATSDSG
jgi:chemotaxis protein histidine kinase CheA